MQPTIGQRTCVRSVNAVTCCTIGRTIWRSAGSLTVGARQSAISSLLRHVPGIEPRAGIETDFATQLRAVETRVDGYIAALEDAQGIGASASVLENLLASPLLFHAGA
jgi:hypothetical protein